MVTPYNLEDAAVRDALRPPPAGPWEKSAAVDGSAG
jgi:hypothetical protein